MEKIYEQAYALGWVFAYLEKVSPGGKVYPMLHKLAYTRPIEAFVEISKIAATYVPADAEDFYLAIADIPEEMDCPINADVASRWNLGYWQGRSGKTYAEHKADSRIE